MAKFVIHIEGSHKKHSLRRFVVPDAMLATHFSYEAQVEYAGWYYMNHIDAVSCTGPYQWSVFPEEMLAEIKG
jgi:hypothetical protein